MISRRPSRAFAIEVAARCLEADEHDETLIAKMRSVAEDMRRTETFEEDRSRVERQRTLFNMLSNGRDKERLKKAMLQRAYDLISGGRPDECDALLEFLPSDDANAMLDDWEADTAGGSSQWSVREERP